MVNTDKPFTYENSTNPWIMDIKDISKVIEIDGNKITAEYMWTLTEKDREECLINVFNYYREHGFPYEILSDDEIIKEFNKLKKYQSDKVINPDGYVSNSGSLCLELCRYFCNDKFWKASSETMESIEDVFYNDEMFIKVLKNRMGWNATKEGSNDGETMRPYLFGITDRIIRDGIRNSGYGYGVSNFRPTIAKWIYEKYLNNIEHPAVFDYSCGWGARAMAAASLGYDYYGTDPLTAENVNKLGLYLQNHCDIKSCITAFESGSEVEQTYKEIPMVDMCMSCPPYFKLEVYSDEATQSYNEFDEFNEWINQYWDRTVKNCDSILKNNGYFILIIKDFYKKFPLKDAMVNVIEKYGYELLDTYQYKTSTNHLSGKVKTGKVSKNSEYILVFQKIKNFIRILFIIK